MSSIKAVISVWGALMKGIIMFRYSLQSASLMVTGFKHKLYQELKGEMAGTGVPSFPKSARMGRTPSVPFLSQEFLRCTDHLHG